MPRKSSAIPIRNPTTGQTVTSSDWPALPSKPTRPVTGVQTRNLKPLKGREGRRARRQEALQFKSTVSGEVDHEPDKLDLARREAREAIVTLNLSPKSPKPNKNDLAHDSEDLQASFNIYARPFVPRSLTIINSLPGHSVHTPPAKGIQYDEYVAASFGPASGFLPRLPLPAIPTVAVPARSVSVGPRNYEVLFQQCLAHEAEARRKEMEACSLYGHRVDIVPSTQGEAAHYTICSLQVPGLRENSPSVEEDDVVQLRQLVYEDGTTNLRGMAEWLILRDQFERDHGRAPAWQATAPGWTQIIYHVRVLGIVRATETLHLKLAGLPFVGTSTNQFNIQFEVPLERNMPMSFALADAHHGLFLGGWMNSMLFPTNADVEIQEKLHTGIWTQKFYDKDLNWEQKKAVESALLRTHGTLPYLISGPPGTGKTKTIIEIALQMVKNPANLNHILLCAPSDPAADTLCARLTAQLGPAEMLRLCRPSRTFAEVPGSLLPYCCVQGSAFGLPPLETLVKFRVIVTTCRDSAMLTRARVTNRDICAIQRGIRSLSAALTPYERLPEVKLHWAGLLLDEAAQAMEPEALIPLTIVAPPAEHDYNSSAPVVVMAGDEHQLGPRTVLPSSALRESLFARLFKRPVYADHPLARGKKGEAPPPLTKALLPVLRPAFANLIRNYRSHPAILAVPSNLFYWDTLEPEAKDTDRLADWEGWQGRGWPVLFHDNQSLDDLERPGMMEGTGGWINAGEAAVACGYAQSLVQSGLVTQTEVCIMSPFRSQVRVLRETMRKQEYGAMWDVNIGPTEAFQGLERGVVILCVTRARQKFVQEDQKLGWGIIGMPNKMNVALTRAKYGLIVVGSRDLLWDDPNWKAFLQFCERNGLLAQPKAPNGANGQGGASLAEEALTRQEKVMLEREKMREMSEAPVWRQLHQEQAGEEMTLPDPEDGDHEEQHAEDFELNEMESMNSRRL